MKKQKSFIWTYINKFKWQYAAGIFTLFIVDYFNLYIPQFIGEITDGLTNHIIDINGIIVLIIKILIVATILMVGRFLWRIFIFGSANKIDYLIRNDMFKKLETLSLRYFNENKTGDLMAHFTNDLSALHVAIGPAVISSFDAIIMSIMVITKMMTYVDFKLTLLAMVPMSFIAIGGYYFGESFEKRFSIKQKTFAKLSDFVQESITGSRILKAFVHEKKEAKAFDSINQENLAANMGVVKLRALVLPLMDLVIGASYVLAIVYGGYLTLLGTISLGKFIAFNQYLGSLVWPMIAIGDSITSFSQGRSAIKRIKEIFDEKSDIKENDNPIHLDNIKGAIEFENVCFKYHKELPNAMENISIKIKPGETLAIIGKTGAGKTTLVNLLLRLYDPNSGRILVDNCDIKDMSFSSLRENIAYVPQDNFLFSQTLKDNLAFGKLDANEDEIITACKQACVHENIIDFSEGYMTLVGERGVTLSGGQKQRSSIARALLKKAPILILDDALSAVDTDTEKRILENLSEERKDKTTIIIAHRLSTIANADHVLVLDHGRCAQYGSIDELLKEDGIYRKMYEKQQLEEEIASA